MQSVHSLNYRLTQYAAIVLPVIFLMLPVAVSAQNPAPVKFVGVQKSQELASVTSVAISPQGKFLYASAWRVKANSAFTRDPQNGKLTALQTVSDPQLLDGATALRLSNSGKLAVSASFRSKTLTLYSRDPDNGLLTLLDIKTHRFGGVMGLSFAVDAVFSADDKHVFVLNVNTGVTSFAIGGKPGDERLTYVGQNQIAGLLNPRGIAVHPDGETVIVPCKKSHTLYVLKRDAKTGSLKLHQKLTDGENNTQGLEGCFGVDIAPQGDFVYTTSGRFGGDNAIGVFRFDKKKKTLTVVQELIQSAASNQIPGFAGGNEIAVSPDGKRVYVVATLSGSLATLSRDAQTGKLKLLSIISNANLKGAAGVAVSPDNKFVYVAAEEAGQIAIFQAQ